jgi:primosomal protein N' (replication factor Y)
LPVAGGDAALAAQPGESSGPDADLVRFLVRAPRSAGTALAAELRTGQAARTAKKEAGVVRLELDPAELI